MDLGANMNTAAIEEFLCVPEETEELLEKRRRAARNQRNRYHREKRKFHAELAAARGLAAPRCEMLVVKRAGPNAGKLGPCECNWKLQIDHVYEGGKGYKSSDVAGAGRWDKYRADLQAWLEGDGRREIRFLCSRHNASYQPVPYPEKPTRKGTPKAPASRRTTGPEKLRAARQTRKR